VGDTDETTGDVTSGSGVGFISGKHFNLGAGIGVHCKSFQRVVNVFISSRPASNADAFRADAR
jgi:hypothetical protein